MTLEYALQEWRRGPQPSNRLLPTPYRIMVSAVGLKRGKRYRKYTALTEYHYGYMGWNPVQVYQEARLPNAGSFLYPGITAVRQAAMDYLALSTTYQVSIRTNQDRSVYVYHKRPDGAITGYATE